MPFNGSGVFVRLRNWVNDAAANIRIRADYHDSEDDNFASGLSQCITKDGQTTITANLPMANYRHTGVGAAAAATDYARYDQVQIGTSVWADAGGTADAITATYSPATTTPADGQLYFVRASAANATTTPTFSPDGSTARTIVKNGNQALEVANIAGDGHELILRYRLSDTKYELLNPAATITKSGNNTFTGTNAFNAAVTFGAAYNGFKGANIASATTTNIGAATGNFVHITGTTTITAFDTVQAGTVRILTFDGILTLTHNGTSLILPTSANITTAAGDNAIFVSEGSGNWRCVSYNRANGQQVSSLASQLSSLLGFSSYYESSQQSFSLGSAVTVTHSLGGDPTFVQFDLVCTTTDGGYSVGDVITMPCSLRFTSGSASFTKGMVLGYNSTDVFLTIGADTISWVTKNGASQFNLTVANWRIVLKAWR